MILLISAWGGENLPIFEFQMLAAKHLAPSRKAELSHFVQLSP